MKDADKIKTALGRTKKALTLKPSLGKDTHISKVRITAGLTCEVHEGSWNFKADMPEAVGGNNSAPTPGVYGRAALGCCLAIGYIMKAAELDIPVDNLEVEIQADFDDGALLGTADKSVSPGYSEIRYSINIESEAPEERIIQMLNEADTHSPYLDIFTHPQKCIRKVNIIPAKTIV